FEGAAIPKAPGSAGGWLLARMTMTTHRLNGWKSVRTLKRSFRNKKAGAKTGKKNEARRDRRT
ncbi:MAG: hypothetical protein LBU46_02610, partial [Candidatus Accumulibacter sp.]|nr:hypothetical protein [Accumulibacter sp.]